jgi:hypothetical protein
MRRRQQGRLVRFAALALGAIALAVAARGLERHNTWYLASDQYAFLTIAADLQRGTVFHDPTALQLVVPLVKPGWAYDALVQTYFYRDGLLYSRYPPGFPGLLAAVGLVGGEAAQHWLNPVLYLTILALVGWLTWVLVRANDRAVAAGSAVASMWLLLLLPTDVHLWGITVARDLPAHLLALGAVLAAVHGRAVVCGLVLGLACTIRPDAALYGVSLAAVFRVEGVRLRDMLLGGLAFVVGALPLFAYNWATGGHPLAFTQGGEFREVLGWVGTRGMATAQSIVFGSGGAFRVSNLWHTLPGNAGQLARSLGWLGVLTVLGIAWAVRSRRVLAAALVPYPVVALVFYSCWSHPDARYLAGVALCLIPLTGVGAVVGCRWVARAERPGVLAGAVLAGALVVVAQRWLPVWLRVPGIGSAETALAGAFAAAALVRLVPRPGAALARLVPLAPAVALATLALTIVATSRGARDPFQRAQIERARQVLGAIVPPGSLVVTSEALGRPAENVGHYLGVHAYYPGEFSLLNVNHRGVVSRHLLAGKRVFYMLRADDRDTLRAAQPMDPHRLVAKAQGKQLHDWFVDPAGAPFGVALYEIEPTPATLELRRLLASKPADEPSRAPDAPVSGPAAAPDGAAPPAPAPE